MIFLIPEIFIFLIEKNWFLVAKIRVDFFHFFPAWILFKSIYSWYFVSDLFFKNVATM